MAVKMNMESIKKMLEQPVEAKKPAVSGVKKKKKGMFAGADKQNAFKSGTMQQAAIKLMGADTKHKKA